MDPTPPLSGHERIHDGPDITVVDLEDCSAREVGSVYRVLTTRLTQGELRGVLVKSGRRSPDGHRALSDALRSALRHAGVPGALRLALLPQTPRANAAFSEIERQFKGCGIALRIFDQEGEALAWLALEG